MSRRSALSWITLAAVITASLTLLPAGAASFCGVFFNAVGPITLDRDGNVYASVLACDPAFRGVWKVSPDGTAEVLGRATTPPA